MQDFALSSLDHRVANKNRRMSKTDHVQFLPLLQARDVSYFWQAMLVEYSCASAGAALAQGDLSYPVV